MTPVSFYACSSYEDRAAIRRALRGILADIGGAEVLFRRGKRVVVKPNLVMKKSPEAAATTHPAVLGELFSLLFEYTDDVTVVECPGGPSGAPVLEAVYRTTGIRSVCEQFGVPIVLEPQAMSVTLPDAAVAKELSLSREMMEADVFINVGKLKSHSLTTFTACAKNLYGAIPGLAKVEYHARYAEIGVFSDLICDINRALVPTLNLLDAVVGMEGNGPTGGTPRKIGGLIGSTDAFALDVLAARLIGLGVQDAPILRAAQKRGLIPGDAEYFGDDYEPFVLSDFRLADAQRFSILREMPNLRALRRFLEPRPVISDRCVGCGECVRLCPAKTIVLQTVGQKRRAVIRKKNCIRCYCCQELCPAKAVDTRSRRILRI